MRNRLILHRQFLSFQYHNSSVYWNLSNTDDLSYFLSIIVAVVYGKFAVIQFWQNL